MEDILKVKQKYLGLQIPVGTMALDNQTPMIVNKQREFVPLIESQDLIEVTKEEADVLIAENKLKPFHWYKISGFHKNIDSGPIFDATGTIFELYDDGTNSGTTIYLLATSENQFSENGYGEFYDAIVKKTNYFTVDKVRANSDLYGIWDGENPVVEDRPTYSVGEEVIWGGYVWRNKTGNIGSCLSTMQLDSANWEKIQYSDESCYNMHINEIIVDYYNNVIVQRSVPSIKVTTAVDSVLYEYNRWSNISLFPFFLYYFFEDKSNRSQHNFFMDIEIYGGISNLINFKGVAIQAFKSYAYIGAYSDGMDANTYFGFGSAIISSEITNSGALYGCAFISDYTANQPYSTLNYSAFRISKLNYASIDGFLFITPRVNQGLSNWTGVSFSDISVALVNRPVSSFGKMISNLISHGDSGYSILNYSSATLIFNQNIGKTVVLLSDGSRRIMTISPAGAISLNTLNA